MDENKYILSDEDLLDLSELAPLQEGGNLEDFLREAKEVMRAIDEAKADDGVLVDDRAWAVYLMRGFYLLGVLRGGEAYRAALLIDGGKGDAVPETVRFTLSESCTSSSVWELKGEPTETLKAIYEVLDLTHYDSSEADSSSSN